MTINMPVIAAARKRHAMRPWSALPFILVLILLLSACGNAALFDQIAETDANEMISILGKAGIVASKKQRSADGWRVVVQSADVAQSLQILSSAGLPHERFRTIGELFPKEGLISTPVEEHMRTIYAVSQELSKTISSIDGVIQVRVHLNMPRRESLLQEPSLPTASVFVKYRAEMNMSQHVLAIKNLVVGGVKGLTHENVMVSVFPWSAQSALQTTTSYRQAFGIAVSPASYSRLTWLIYLPWILLGTILAAGLFFFWYALERSLVQVRPGRRLRQWWQRHRGDDV